MTAIQFVNVLRQYGADVLLLAVGVTLLTSLLKKTVLKNCPKKVFVFLPFLIGLVVYAVFRAVATWSAAPFTDELFQTLEGGMGCGSAATIYYILYEQFLRKGSAPLSLKDLIERIVPADVLGEAAGVLETIGKEGAENALERIKETLIAYAVPSLTEVELEASAAAIANFFQSLKS